MLNIFECLPLRLRSALIKGNCIPFIGAGFSRNAILPEGLSMPDWQDLVKCITSSEGDIGDPIKALTDFEVEYGRGTLVANLRECLHLRDAKPGPVHDAFCRISFDHVITTNYDQLLEYGYNKCSRGCFPISDPTALAIPAIKRANPLRDELEVRLIKCHGDINIYNSLVITERDYKDSKSTRDIIMSKVITLLTENTLLLLGHGLDDPDILDILTLLFDNLNVFKQPAFVILNNPTIQDSNIYRNLGIEIHDISDHNVDYGTFYVSLFNELNAILTNKVTPVHISEQIPDKPDPPIILNYLEEEKIIRQHVTTDPTNYEDEDIFLDDIFNDLSKVRFFARYASSTNWLKRISEKGYLDPLFDDSCNLEPPHHYLAWWLKDNYIYDRYEDIMKLIIHGGNKINPEFGNIIALSLQHCNVNNKNEMIRKWIVTLMSLEISGEYSQWFQHLLGRVTELEDIDSVTLLIGYLTTPRLTYKDYSYLNNYNTYIMYDIKLNCKLDMLKYTWTNIIVPRLNRFALHIEPILTRQMQIIHSINSVASNYDKYLDPDLDDSLRSGPVEFLYSCITVVIENIIANDNVVALGIIRKWLKLDVPILEKAALYGLSKLSLDNSTPIIIMLDSGLVFRQYCEYEILDLLNNTYSYADTETKHILLNELKDYWRDLEINEMKDEVKGHKARLLHRKLIAINSLDPEDSSILSLKSDIEDVYLEFKVVDKSILKKPEKPRVETLKPSISAGGFLEMEDPSEVLEVLNKNKEGYDDWHREVDLRELSEAVKINFEWGWRLKDYLVETKKWEKEIWNSIFEGWVRQQFSEDIWDKILGFLAKYPKLEEHIYYTSWLLDDGMTRREGSITVNQIDKAIIVADRLRIYLLRNDEKYAKNEDLFTITINSCGGHIASFYIEALSKVWNVEESDKGEILDKLKDGLQNIVKGNNNSSRYGRVITAGQFPFLYNRERAWTVKWVKPWFDWEKNEERAYEAWTGFLLNSHPYESVVKPLMPFYMQTIDRYGDELDEKVKEFLVRHVAFIVTSMWQGTISENMLTEFIKESTPENRCRFARVIGETLESGEEKKVIEQWEGWLKVYWNNRNQNELVPLSPEETAIMLEWVIPLETVFDDAVSLVCEGIPPKLEHTLLFSDLNNDHFIKEKPRALLKMLAFIVENADEGFVPYNFLEIIEIITQIEDPSQHRSDLFRICNNLARLGYDKSLDLAEQLGVLDYSEGE